jgi:hypothetical protein
LGDYALGADAAWDFDAVKDFRLAIAIACHSLGDD